MKGRHTDMATSLPGKSKGKISKVKCRVCSLELLHQNYKDHLKLKHPDTDENDLRPQSQLSLLSFCNPQSELENISSSKSSIHDTQSSHIIQKSSEITCSISTRPLDKSTDFCTRDIESIHIPVNEPTPHHKSIELIEKHNISVEGKLDIIIEKLKDIGEKVTIKSGDNKPITEESSQSNISTISEKLKNCDTIEKLLEEFPEFEMNVPYFICQVCKSKSASSDISGSSCGRISLPEYDAEASDSTRNFRNFKIKINLHFERDTHIEALAALSNEQTCMKKIFTRDIKVGITLGTLVYDLTKTAKPDLAYEEQVSLLAINGFDVVELNH